MHIVPYRGKFSWTLIFKKFCKALRTNFHILIFACTCPLHQCIIFFCGKWWMSMRNWHASVKQQQNHFTVAIIRGESVEAVFYYMYIHQGCLQWPFGRASKLLTQCYYFSILLSHIRITPCIGWSYLVPLSSIAKRAAPLAVDADLPGAQHTETKEYQWEVRLQYKLDASSTNMYERQFTGTNTLQLDDLSWHGDMRSEQESDIRLCSQLDTWHTFSLVSCCHVPCKFHICSTCRVAHNLHQPLPSWLTIHLSVVVPYQPLVHHCTQTHMRVSTVLGVNVLQDIRFQSQKKTNTLPVCSN